MLLAYLLLDLIYKNMKFVVKMVLLALLIMFLVYSYSEHKLHQNKEWVANVEMWISQGYRTGESYFRQLSDFLTF